MFRSQSIKHTITAGAVALAFVFSSSAMAGQPEGKVVPGKPGPDNIVEIAMAVNGLVIDPISKTVSGVVGTFRSRSEKP